MKIFVKVKTGAKENGVEKIDETHFRVLTKSSPVEGKANASVLKLLAEYFNVAPSRISIISGLKARQKVIEIG